MADYISKWLGQEIDSAVGQVLNKEIGEVVYIPTNVFNLTSSSSSSEIAAAWGGEEYFKTICKRIVNGSYPVLGTKGNMLVDASFIPTNFIASYNEDNNTYNISFVIVTYGKFNDNNYELKFTFNNGTFTAINNPVLASYVNEIVFPKALLSLTNQSTSQDIINAWGSLERFQRAAWRGSQRNVVMTIEGDPKGYQPISYNCYYNNTSDLSITFSILNDGNNLQNVDEVRQLETYRFDYKDGVAAILIKTLVLVDQERFDQYYLPSAISSGNVVEGWFRIADILINDSFANSAIVSFMNNYNYNTPNLVTFWFSSWRNEFYVKILGSWNLSNIKKVRTAVKSDDNQEAYLDVYVEFSGGNNIIYSASNVIGFIRFLKDFQGNPSTEGYTLNEVSLIE